MGEYGINLVLHFVKIFSNSYGYSEKFCLVQKKISLHLAPSAIKEQVSQQTITNAKIYQTIFIVGDADGSSCPRFLHD